MAIGSPYRAQSDHPAAADAAREQPGMWVLAGLYPSGDSARSTAREIERGTPTFPAYVPVGQFEAQAVPSEEDYALWVRYVPRARPADATAGPATLIRKAAEARRSMHAKQAARLLAEHGYERAAELVLTELRVRRGHMSARQAADYLVELNQPAASIRTNPTPKDYA
ncbi:hypothetical protein [Streptomyces sp. NPDC007346]|uniref:hypothetical protein n=1 Tax=Streptomyces sp. NPDC007346 TaxID=3154682 RepID=UPI003455793E